MGRAVRDNIGKKGGQCARICHRVTPSVITPRTILSIYHICKTSALQPADDTTPAQLITGGNYLDFQALASLRNRNSYVTSIGGVQNYFQSKTVTRLTIYITRRLLDDLLYV